VSAGGGGEKRATLVRGGRRDAAMPGEPAEIPGICAVLRVK
jgi:hypothetical protein